MTWLLDTRNPEVNGRPGGQVYPAGPAAAVAFRGNGENLICIDWENDLVVATMRARRVGDFFRLVVESVNR